MKNVSHTQQRRLLESFIRESLISSPRLLAARPAPRVMLEAYDREMEILLTEGFMESLQSAYETVKGGVVKLKDKISSVALAAMEKANEMFVGLIASAADLAVSAPQKAISLCRNIVARVEAFQRNHPILFKVIMLLITAIIVAAIFGMFSGNEAQAAITAKGKNIDADTYSQMKGMLFQHMDKLKTVDGLPDIDKKLMIGNAIKQLDMAMKSPDAVPIESIQNQSGNVIRKTYDIVQELINSSKSGNAVDSGVLDMWLKVGRETVTKMVGG